MTLLDVLWARLAAPATAPERRSAEAPGDPTAYDLAYQGSHASLNSRARAWKDFTLEQASC